MNSNRLKHLLGMVLLLVMLPAASPAMSPGELDSLIRSDEKPTVIDIRDAASFQAGHIPEAIHIVGRLIPDKKFPPIGRVVVYGDGLDEAPVKTAADALNGKPGITAETLEGGLLRWEAENLATTRPKGMSKEKIPYVTYQQLSAMTKSNPAVVLVDLRRQQNRSRSIQSTGGTASDGIPLTDLSAAFPGTRVAASPFEPDQQTRSILSRADDPEAVSDKLYVLIDNGDGTAEILARRMKASGKKRFVILNGGEMTLMRKGKPGLNTK